MKGAPGHVMHNFMHEVGRLTRIEVQLANATQVPLPPLELLWEQPGS